MDAVPKRKRTPTKVVEAMDIASIRPYFTVPLSKASKELGISENCLKKICRRVGIARWPYREIADVQRTIQRIEQSSGSPGEEDERTAALLSGLRLQEHLLLTRGKSEQPPVTEPPSKMAKRDAPALSRLPYHFTPVVDAKERLLSAAYAQDDSTSKLSASPELYPPELSSSKGFADASTASSTPESSPRVHADFSYAWPPAMPWYTAHDQQAAAAAALAAARYLGSVPQLSPTSADAAAAAAGRAARSTLAYQQQLWAAAHAQAQWYAAERAMRFYY